MHRVVLLSPCSQSWVQLVSMLPTMRLFVKILWLLLLLVGHYAGFCGSCQYFRHCDWNQKWFCYISFVTLTWFVCLCQQFVCFYSGCYGTKFNRICSFKKLIVDKYSHFPSCVLLHLWCISSARNSLVIPACLPTGCVFCHCFSFFL